MLSARPLRLFVVIALAAAAARAQGPAAAWTPLGPYGGTIAVLVADPFHPLTVYAGTRDARVFRTLDGGLTWTPASDGLSGASPWFQGLAADPRRPGRLWAGDDSGQVFTSPDFGLHWAAVAGGRLSSPVRALLVSGRSGELFAATDAALFRRTRGGRWSVASSRPACCLTEDSLGVLYAGSVGRVLRSGSGGVTWQRGAPVPVQGTIEVLRAQGPRLLLAGTSSGLWESTSGGAAWSRTPSLGRFVTSFAAPAQGQPVFAGTSEGVFVSPNSRAPWARTARSPADPFVTALARSSGGLFAGTFAQLRPGGVFRSRDGGRSWVSAERGLNAQAVSAIAAAPDDPQRLLLGIFAAGLLESDDGGDHWRSAGLDEDSSPNVSAIAIDPFDSTNVLVAAGPAGLLRSSRGGPWTATGKVASRVAFDPASPHVAWANGTLPLAFLRTPDAGETWQEIAFPPADFATVLGLSIAVDGALYAVGYFPSVHFQPSQARVYRVTESSAVRVDAPFAGARIATAIAADPSDANVVYVVVDGALWKTSDRAAHWSRVALPIRAPIQSLAVLPSGPAVLIATGVGGTPSRILTSADGGGSWSAVALPPGVDTRVLRLAVSAGRLFALPATGVYERTVAP